MNKATTYNLPSVAVIGCRLVVFAIPSCSCLPGVLRMEWSAANKYHLEGLSVDGSSAAAAEVSTETSEEGETAAEDADGTSEAESAAETAQQ